MPKGYSSIDAVSRAVVQCERCPRLRRYCRKVASLKKREFREWTYWGKPVPGFGDPKARLFIVGLAPAAHGGNRTGRVFTGTRPVTGSAKRCIASDLPTSRPPVPAMTASS